MLAVFSLNTTRLIATIVCVWTALATKLSADEGPGNSAYHTVFTQPPQPLPLYEQLDAPLMGNGDMAAALCGDPEKQEFWLSKNDLWELRPVWRMSGPRPFGHLDIEIPELKKASYHVEQNLADATTVSTFKTGKSQITMRSWVAATENLLVVELACEGAPVDGRGPALDPCPSQNDTGVRPPAEAWHGERLGGGSGRSREETWRRYVLGRPGFRR